MHPLENSKLAASSWQEVVRLAKSIRNTQQGSSIPKSSPALITVLSCLVDPLGYPQEAPHLWEGHGTQAAHSAKTVQAQEVDACRGLALWSMCLHTLLHLCRPIPLPGGLRVMFCRSRNHGGSSCDARKGGTGRAENPAFCR